VREETLLTPQSISAKTTFLDWDTQPSLFKHYPHFCYRIKLSDFPSLQWLEHARCITDERSVGQKPYYRFNVPSAGNLHPIEIYVQLRNIVGALSGIYHLDSLNGELVMITEIAGEGIEPFLGLEHRFNGALLMMSLVPFRSSWKYGLRAWRYLYLDLGHQISALGASVKHFGLTLTKMSPLEGLNTVMGMGNDEVIAAVYGIGESSLRSVKPLHKPLMCVQPTDYTERNKKLYSSIESVSIYTDLPIFTQYEDFLKLNATRRSAREFDASLMCDDVIKKLLNQIPLAGIESVAIVLQAQSMHLGVYRSGECAVKGNFVSQSVRLLLDQRFIAGANMVLLIYSENFCATSHIEAGMYAQNLYMVCENHHIGCSGIGAFYDEEGSYWSTNPLIYAVAVGGKR
jgi:SagB-type dehydrogenase family enzyme